MKLHRDLDITQKSAWHLGALGLREGLKGRMPGQFTSPGEADESFFGGKAKNMQALVSLLDAGRDGVRGRDCGPGGAEHGHAHAMKAIFVW